MYAPHIMLRRYISKKIFNWADKKYGVEARGEVKGFKMYNHPVFGVYGVSNFTPRQEKMLKKWHFWMKFRNRL